MKRLICKASTVYVGGGITQEGGRRPDLKHQGPAEGIGEVNP